MTRRIFLSLFGALAFWRRKPKVLVGECHKLLWFYDAHTHRVLQVFNKRHFMFDRAKLMRKARKYYRMNRSFDPMDYQKK